MQQTFEGHPVEVYDAVFSPDGKRLATASVDETAKVWDVASGRELAALAGACQPHPANCVQLTPTAVAWRLPVGEPKHKSMG